MGSYIARGNGKNDNGGVFTGSDEDFERITKAIEDSGFNYVGLRITDKKMNIGATDRLSTDLSEYSDNYGGKLNGTSTVGMDIQMNETWETKEELTKAIEQARKTGYIGKSSHMYIVGGENGSYGDDPGELIINNNDMQRRRGAKVIYMLN